MVESARPRASVCTLGCRVNQYESEAIEAELEALGFIVADFSEVCDVYIINTCAVTGESERKSRQMIRRAAAKNPAAFVLVTGCFSQLKAEEAARIPGVDYVCGNRNKRSVAETAAYLVREGVKRGVSCNVLDLDGAPLEKLTSPRARRDRSYVKIEDGCDNNCTYCIIKKARGGVVSRPPEEVIAEVRTLTAAGCHEVILTGIEAASYGKDIGGYPLWRLMREAAAVEGIERVRTGSLEPSVLTKRFCDEIAAEPRIMPSFHLSLQSGSSAVLAAMKRRYNREQVLENTAYLRDIMPNVTFTCDIIVGFPGETYEEFCETLSLIREVEFTSLFTFIFSPRPGTRAAEMEDPVTYKEKTQWFSELLKTQEEIAAKRCASMVGSTERVLIEERNEKNGLLSGRTASSIIVEFPGEDEWIGEFKNVKVTEARNWILRGECVD